MTSEITHRAGCGVPTGRTWACACNEHQDEILGVLTGQVPVRSMPIAGYENTQAAKDEDPDWTDRDGSE